MQGAGRRKLFRGVTCPRFQETRHTNFSRSEKFVQEDEKADLKFDNFGWRENWSSIAFAKFSRKRYSRNGNFRTNALAPCSPLSHQLFHWLYGGSGEIAVHKQFKCEIGMRTTGSICGRADVARLRVAFGRRLLAAEAVWRAQFVDCSWGCVRWSIFRYSCLYRRTVLFRCSLLRTTE